MNAADFTFGIEIECTIPAGAFAVGGYHRGVSVAGLPAGWEVQGDSSIRTVRGRLGAEVVSPVLRGADGLRQVQDVCRFLQAAGAKVNQSTGLHVHVGFRGEDAKALDRLITLTANFERAIYASTGTRSRERGRWCGSVQHLGNVETGRRGGRYRVLNLTNLLTGTRPAVEFRAFAGTLNAGKIIGYVRLCVGLAERAHKAKRVTDWAAKPTAATSPIKRAGEGQTHLTRLFYQLGWIKGRQPHTHGDLVGEGLPDMADTKRTLMKLARKYDAGR